MPDPATPLQLVAFAIFLLVASASTTVFLQRRALAAVYPACLAAAGLALVAHCSVLLTGTTAVAQLPVGLPTIGLRFRLDALSAFFGVVVNLGVIATALYGLGLDRLRDLTPRVETYFPAFAAAMNAVLLADDAFGFLFFWELMSVTSWVLVLARHEDADARQAAHVYLVMAAIGTTALLFAFGGTRGPGGRLRLRNDPQNGSRSTRHGSRARPVVVGTGSKAGHHAVSCLAAARPSGGAESCLGGDVRVMTKVAMYGCARRLRPHGAASRPGGGAADRARCGIGSWRARWAEP